MTRPVAAKDYWDKGIVRRYIATKIFDALLIDRKEVKVHQSPVELMIRESARQVAHHVPRRLAQHGRRDRRI